MGMIFKKKCVKVWIEMCEKPIISVLESPLLKKFLEPPVKIFHLNHSIILKHFRTEYIQFFISSNKNQIRRYS